MDMPPAGLPSDDYGWTAYERASAQRFFEAAEAERSRLVAEIEEERRRIAAAEAELADAFQAEVRLTQMILDTERILQEAVQANQEAVSATLREADAEAERIMAEVEARAGELAALLTRAKNARAAADGTPPPASGGGDGFFDWDISRWGGTRV